jgi:hypothetical protein
LKTNEYIIPSANESTAHQFANKTDLNYFEFMQSISQGQQFNNHMVGYFTGRPPWVDERLFPAHERIVKGASQNDESVMLVDVGGGNGHYTDQFRVHFPDTPGRLILQDLSPVIDNIQSLHPKIEKMVHDFFTEQPIKGGTLPLAPSVLCPLLDRTNISRRAWSHS